MKTQNDGTFKNTKWLITGGTSGLGLALTELLLKMGAQIAVVARNEKRLFELAKRLPIIPILADVKNKEDTYKISALALGQLGSIDFLVNNASQLAGGHHPLKLLLDTDCEDLEEVLQTNIVGPFRLIKAVLPSMILQKRGTVINISSDAAVNAYPSWGPYGSSKAALDHLSHVWATEVQDKNIQFLSIDPGDMDTPMHALALPEADRQSLKAPQTAADQLLKFIELKLDDGERKMDWIRKSL